MFGLSGLKTPHRNPCRCWLCPWGVTKEGLGFDGGGLCARMHVYSSGREYSLGSPRDQGAPERSTRGCCAMHVREKRGCMKAFRNGFVPMRWLGCPITHKCHENRPKPHELVCGLCREHRCVKCFLPTLCLVKHVQVSHLFNTVEWQCTIHQTCNGPRWLDGETR